MPQFCLLLDKTLVHAYMFSVTLLTNKSNEIHTWVLLQTGMGVLLLQRQSITKSSAD